MQPMQLNNHKINKRQRFRWAKYTDSKYIIHMWINFGGTQLYVTNFTPLINCKICDTVNL